jgi:hypothetical protein
MRVDNNPLTGEWPVTIVNQILKQMPGLAKPQTKFLTLLLATILARRGRMNFRNLSRYCDYSERTVARQFRRDFAWPLSFPRAASELTAWIISSTLVPGAPSAVWKSRRWRLSM